MNLNPDIFKAYDVRGVYPNEVNEEAALAIGGAFVAYLQAKRIAVGRDMRVSSPALASAFIEGAVAQGADVVDYGMIATDMLYFAVARDGHDGGVQITASHNPKQYNGMKMVRKEAFPLSGEEGLAEIRDMIQKGTLPAAAARPGQVTKKDALAPYVDHVMSFVDPSVIKPLNVVLDAGSGMGGLVAPKLFDRLPCKTTRLCFEIDGRFPNHEANPLIEENRRDIVERVKAGARIGPYSVVGRQCHIEEHAVIDGAIVWANTRISQDAVVRRSILGRHCHLGRNATVDDGVVLGDKSVVTDYSKL